MAFVIKRRDGRYEIRESVTTPRGPRSRSLATFRELSDAVLDRAASRAATHFDRDRIATRARELGAPRDPRATARLGWQLLSELHAGHALPAVLAEALAAQIGLRESVPDTVAPLLDWIGVGPRERGEALRDLLRVTDRLPARTGRPRKPFPRIASIHS